MDTLGLDIAKALAGKLGCKVMSYKSHGRHGGIVIVSGTYDPAFMQSLLRTAADLCSARGYPAVTFLVGGASTARNAKGRICDHTGIFGDWGVRGSKRGDSTFASFAFEFSANCGLLADGGMHQADVGLEATVCRDVGAAFGLRYPAIQCGNKNRLGANFLFDLINKTGLVYVVLATKPSTEPRDLLLEAQRGGADVTRGGGISRGPNTSFKVDWMQALLYLVAARGLAQRHWTAIAAALNEAFGLELTMNAAYQKYAAIAEQRETASPVTAPVSEAEVAVALDAKRSAEKHLADLTQEVVRVLKARAAALAAGDDADEVLAARAARRRDQDLLQRTALWKLGALFVGDGARFFAAESSAGESSSGESSAGESSSDSSDDESSSDEEAAPARRLRCDELSVWPLRRIVARTGCVVVLSSTAPRGVAAALGREIGAEKLKATAAVANSGSAEERQVHEVLQWLDQWPADRWVCLDETGGLRAAYARVARAAGAVPVFAARFVSAAPSFDEETLRAVTFDEGTPPAAAAPHGSLPFLPPSYEITRADIAGREIVVTGRNFLSQRILELVLEIRFGANIMSKASRKTHIVIGPASCLEGERADQSANAKHALYTPTENPENGGHAVFLVDTKLEAMLRKGEVADALREKRGSLPAPLYVTALAVRPWRRQVCVVTGEVDGYDQVAFLAALRDTLDAKTWDRVTDDTTLLIVGDLGGRASSTKLDMARVLKVNIVRAAEVLKLLASPPAVFADVTNGAGRPAKKTRV